MQFRSVSQHMFLVCRDGARPRSFGSRPATT